MFFDAHIHFDKLSKTVQNETLQDKQIAGLLAVAMDLSSCQQLLKLQKNAPHKVYIAAGFHPEQSLPNDKEQTQLFDWLAKHQQNLTAIGEIGLPHYLKRENPALNYQPYLALLEHFILFAKRSNLPLNLHIVHNDVQLALGLLQKYQIEKAHFHWFKTDNDTLNAFLATPYYASLTPDILWNPKTQKIAKKLPLERLMIETDSPWQHEGLEKASISTQLNAIVKKLAQLKGISEEKVATIMLENSLDFYRIKR